MIFNWTQLSWSIYGRVRPQTYRRMSDKAGGRTEGPSLAEVLSVSGPWRGNHWKVGGRVRTRRKPNEIVPERLPEEPARVSYSGAGEGDGSRERYSQGNPKKGWGLAGLCKNSLRGRKDQSSLCTAVTPNSWGALLPDRTPPFSVSQPVSC